MERISRRNAEETPEDREVRLHERRFRYREIERQLQRLTPTMELHLTSYKLLIETISTIIMSILYGCFFI